jgi:putative spermidine/putrescine transport system permease protein
MALPRYASGEDRLWYYGARIFTGLVLCYLVLPILIIVPISFTAGNLLAFPMPGFSLRWYESLVEGDAWLDATRNSLIVGLSSTALSLALGTLAAVGLSRARFRLKPLVLAVLVSPMVIPIVIVAVAVYFLFVGVGLVGTYLGLILAHTALASPFVVISMMAALDGYDVNLSRAAASLGARPLTVFRRVTLPMVFPGFASGALFAFATSFDEIVVALFIASPEQRTLPRQIFSGVREYVSPGIAAVATILVLLSAALLILMELLRRRSQRLRSIAKAR